jgi:dephospho-CoA kinase
VLRVGLTGGIASGKTTVSEMFQNAGAIVIDADRIARQVVAPGLPAWRAITALFGEAVLAPDGTLDRGILGEKVFNDSSLRHQLEAIVHPHVRAQMDVEVKRLEQTAPHAVVILDVPLLLETRMEQGLAEVIVVYVPRQVQLQRLMQRNGLDRDQAGVRIDAQISMQEKRRRATIVIDNSGDRAHTQRQALAVYRDLSQRAGLHAPK